MATSVICFSNKIVLFFASLTRPGSFKKAMFDSIIAYFRSSKEELEKVNWPSKEETLRYSVLIIVGSVAAAVLFGALDFGLNRTVQALISARGRQTAADSAQAPASTTPADATDVQVQPGAIEATDAQGNKVDLNINPVPSSPSAP